MSVHAEAQAEVQAVAEAVDSGAVATASYAELVAYSATLAIPGANRMMGANFEEVSKVVHLHLLRSVIEAFERRSKVQGLATLGFAVIAIVATLMPYFIAPSPNNAPNLAPITSASPLNTPQAQSKSPPSAPIQTLSPSSGQATKKNP